MGKFIRNLSRKSNEEILDSIRHDASSDYLNRIPEATKAGLAHTWDVMNKYPGLRNEFVDALINRIGQTIVREMSWENPLAEFKLGMMSAGATIEEIAVGLIKAKTHSFDRDSTERDLFGREYPNVQSAFHTVNRQNKYKATVDDVALQRAFLDGGLSDFIVTLMAALNTSDQWDEFLLTTSLFKTYETQGGFYHVNVPNVISYASGQADSRLALRKMRAMADTLPFPSTRYNAARMPSFARPDELLLFVTPEFNAAVDVEALAGAFNIDRAEMHGRTIPIPADSFGIEGCQAIMTTKDFFVIADTYFNNTSLDNPEGRYKNYWLHHDQIISASKFAPAVMFWTGADDAEPITITPPETVNKVTAYNIRRETVTQVERGSMYALDAEVLPELADDKTVKWFVLGETGNALPGSPATRITQDGVLHVGGDEPCAKLRVVAQLVYRSPDDLAPHAGRPDLSSKSLTLTVTGDMYPVFPIVHSHDNTKNNELMPDIVVNVATETGVTVNHTAGEYNDDDPGGVTDDNTTVDAK